MDEDSDIDKDLDTSLMDPHHALDSSTEEGENADDTLADCGEFKEDGATATAINGHHVGMLEEMVQEMKQGFQSALEELAKIQDKEDGGHSKKLQQQQQRQLDNLTDTVLDIKEQLASLVKAVEQVQGENKKLREDFQALQAQGRRKGVGSDEHLMIPVDSCLEWTEEGTHNPFENDSSHNSPIELDEVEQNGQKSEDHDEVTAIACKSLSLTQALGEKFMEFNMSVSSEDGEEPSCRRVSSITPKTSSLPEESNRRHSMPASAIASSRNKQMARAAQRQAAVKELADSERDYCSQLWALLDTYLTPLQTTTFLSGEQLDLLFPPFLERMYMEHCMICSGLQDKLVHWSYMGSIANLLSRVTESHNADSLLSLYFEYAEYLPDAITCLRETLTHSTDFKSFLKTIQQSSCQTDDLMTLIIAPVQHLPKYLLQLQQICKHTSSTHPDYLLLQTSLTRLRSFVEQINERVNSAMTIRTAMSQDSRTGSSNDSSQVLSARDSGVHSNEEEVPTPRNFFRSEQNLSPEDWHEDVYYSQRHQHHPRSSSFFHDQWNRVDDQRKLTSHLSALSQPDLTRFDMFGGLSLYNPPGPFSHITRSQSGLPPSGANQPWGNSRDSSVNNQKFKLRPSHGPPSTFQTGDNPHLLPSPRSRPSSAIDFTSSHQHHFHQLDFGTNPTRPRSAMGPIDPNHRPTIISRKHGRRSQPPVSNSGYWPDGNSISHHKLPQTKMAVPPLDLLPSRPSPLPTHISLEDDEEDDTRASDSHSFATSGGSHRQSSSQCSHDDREHELDLRQELSESEHDRGQESRASEFSEDDVAASLAWKLCVESSEKEMTDTVYEHQHLKDSVNNLQQTNEFSHGSHVTSDKKLSLKGETNHDTDHKPEERNGTGLYIKRTQSKALESKRSMPLQSSTIREGSKSSIISDNSISPSSGESSVSSNGTKAAVSRHDKSPKGDDLSSSSSASNKDTQSLSKTLGSESNRVPLVTSVSNTNSFSQKKDHQHSPKNSENVDEGKNTVEHNRRFLLSLAQNPSKSQSTEATSSKKKSVFSSTAQISLKNSGSEVQGKKIETTFLANGSSSGIGDSQNETPNVRTSVSSSSRDKIIRRSAPPDNSYLTNGFQGLDGKAMIKTSSPNTHHKSLSKSGSSMDELDSKGDNSLISASESLDKQKGDNTNKFLETAIDDSVISNQDQEVGCENQKKQLDSKLTRSVDMSDLFITDDSKDKRRDRKKGKEISGTYQPSDSLPKANDDPVGVRKKMHLKSSIKNLFTKKRGRVILADVEREVILEMAKESLMTRKLPPSSSTLLSSSLSSTCNKSFDTENVMAPGISDCRRGIQTNPGNRYTVDACEAKSKTDDSNSTVSASQILQLDNVSPASHEEIGKGNRQKLNALSQTKSWYDFLPFSQKRPLAQTFYVDHSGRFKKSHPGSSQNKSAQKNFVPDGNSAASKQESDKYNSSDMQKISGMNSLNGHSLSSKPVEKRMSSSDFPANSAHYPDFPPQTSPRENNSAKEEFKSQTLEEFTRQQRRKFHEQIKKYTKSKQKGKSICQPAIENQINEKVRDKEMKTRTSKHKDRLNGNDRKVSPVNQCSNCQMKAKKFSVLEQVKEEQANASKNTSSDKKSRNRHHQRAASEMHILSGTSSNAPNSQRIEPSISQNGLCMPSSEEMYVTFSHCLNAPEHHTLHENLRNHTNLSSSPTCQELKDDQKFDATDMKLKTAKSNPVPVPKSDNLSHDVNMSSGAPLTSKNFEKSIQDTGRVSNSVQSSFCLSASKLLQNGDMSLSSQSSNSSTNKLSVPYYRMNGLNGLTFSGSPLCYSGANLTHKNSGSMNGTPPSSHELNTPGSIGPIVHESVKRSNGGEYNNLSLDLQVNSQQAESIQKSYDKRVPWHGGNITSKFPLPDEELQKGSSNQKSHPFFGGTENQNVQKEKSQFFSNKLDSVGNLVLSTKGSTLSSHPSIIVQPPPKASDLSKQKVKSQVDKEDQANNRQLSIGEGEENWQELLTASHDYFDSRYRLCYDADDHEAKNSTPSPILDEPSIARSGGPASLITTVDNSAYVTFVSCPSISVTTEEKNRDSFWRDFPSFTDGKKLPNGTITHSAFITPKVTPTPGAQVKRFNELASQLADSKMDNPVECSLIKTASTFRSLGSKGSDIQAIPIHDQPKNPFNSTTNTKIQASVENENPETLMRNHIISSISVGHGCRAPISPMTANQIYLPMSLANGNREHSSPVTNGISTSQSVANGNKASSVTKDIDYSKSVANSFIVNSASVALSSKLNNFNSTLPMQKDSGSFNVPHGAHMNENFDSTKGNPTWSSSPFPNHPDVSSAPRSLQKLFPSKLSDNENQFSGRQLMISAEDSSSANNTMWPNENDAVQTEDKRKSSAGDGPFSSDHLTLSHCSSSTNAFPKHFSYPCQERYESALGDIDKKDRLYVNSPIEDKTKYKGKTSHKPGSKLNTSNSVFCVLPFEEYTVNNSVQQVPKRFSQFNLETEKQHQSRHHDHTALTKDSKMFAIHMREAKNTVRPKETCRYSSCSSHSANEIQIMKLPDAKDSSYQPNIKDCSKALDSHNENAECERSKKSLNALQVKYTPKSGFRRKKGVDMSAPSSANSPLPTSVVPNNMSFSVAPVPACQHNSVSDVCNTNPSEMSSISEYANEAVAGISSSEGPDLLQVSFAKQGSSPKPDHCRMHTPTRQTPTRQTPNSLTPTRHSEASVAQPKKQSFLARLAHSPLSFLHRDSKNSTESK